MATSLTAQTVVFEDDFESGSGNWTLEGAWGLTTAQSNSPSNSLTDSPGGNYAANVDVSATLATPLDFTDALDANLFFSAIYDIEDGNFDYLFIEASTDGTNWLELDRIFGQGNLTPWIEYDYSLAGFAGEAEVFVRFRFFSDGGFEVDGAYIDDVRVETSDVDNGPPLLVHVGPEFYEGVSGDFVATAQISDISGINATLLSYDVDGSFGGEVEGVDNGDGTFSFTIPAQTVGSQVDYFITATDASPNLNEITVDGFNYIAGTHIFYDNSVVDFVNSFGPVAQGGNFGAAVRFTLSGQSIAYALIRNYTDNNRPNSPMMFHIWDNNGGFPGDDVITPFEIIAEANLVDNSPMTRVDLADFSDDLSNLEGDYFMGFTVPEGETWVVQTTPTISGRTYAFDGANWIQETDDYHFRIVVEDVVALESNDDCVDAYSLDDLLDAGVGVSQNTPIFSNENATLANNDPTEGFECFGDDDAPTLDNTQWFTFTGDGNTYRLRTGECGTPNPVGGDGDTQFALYSGDDCGNLTPVACNEDEDEDNDIFSAFLQVDTEEGVNYYLLVDGWNGGTGEYCIQLEQFVVLTCEDIDAGTSVIEESVVCFNDVVDMDNSGAVIPNTFVVESDAVGFAVVVSNMDISGSTSPFTEMSYAGNFPINPGSYNVAFTNDGALAPGNYFFTPVALVGVYTDDDETPALIDLSNGCAIAGTSIPVTLLPEVAQLSTAVTGEPELDGGANGSASAIVTGGSGDYSYLWDNGETTAEITGLTAGDYTVTISDSDPCVDDAIETYTVDAISATIDQTLDAAIKLFPNPATGLVNLSYDFGSAIDFDLSVSNQLGQTVLTRNVSSATAGSLQFNVSELPAGIYAVRLADGKRFTVKTLVVK